VWHRVTLDTMWVRERCRGRGIGLGREYGVKRDYPPGHSNHHLRKTL
jgi:hypothetical protein